MLAKTMTLGRKSKDNDAGMEEQPRNAEEQPCNASKDNDAGTEEQRQ